MYVLVQYVLALLVLVRVRVLPAGSCKLAFYTRICTRTESSNQADQTSAENDLPARRAIRYCTRTKRLRGDPRWTDGAISSHRHNNSGQGLAGIDRDAFVVIVLLQIDSADTGMPRERKARLSNSLCGRCA